MLIFKTLATLAVLLPAMSFACSMPLSWRVNCGKIENVLVKELDSESDLLVGIQTSRLKSGFLDTACKWMEVETTTPGRIVEVASLKKSRAKKLLNELKSISAEGSEVCVFSTSHLKKNVYEVTKNDSRSTKEIASAAIAKFRDEIKKQIDE